MAIIDCTCRGVNPNCEKCDGKGYYSSNMPKKKKRNGSIVSKIKRVKPTVKTIKRKHNEELIREHPIGDLTVRNIILTYDIGINFLRQLLSNYKEPLTFDTKISIDTWSTIRDDIIKRSLLIESRKKTKQLKRRLTKKSKKK